MKKRSIEAPEWFLMWTGKDLYITMICGWSKPWVIGSAERELSMAWKKIYRCGGRVIRCKVTPVRQVKKESAK
jgi:hypothetical protein